VNEVLRNLQAEGTLADVTVAKLNAQLYSTGELMFAALMQSLHIKPQPGKNATSTLESVFCDTNKTSSTKQLYVVVLDEIDQLISGASLSLYALFGWAKSASNRLVLVGIANLLDLGVHLKHLHRLQCTCNCEVVRD